jgi:LysR family transcriptional regulator, transcriptional activator of nhaA
MNGRHEAGSESMTEKLQDLNFLHLYYFWMVVRHRGITAACELLHLTQPTISTQIRKLEKSLGQVLFDRSGRELELTPVGKTVYEYADEMFAVGREMLGALRGTPNGRAMRLLVGIPMLMPKMITYRLLEPVLHLPNPAQVVIHEAPLDSLVPDLLRHQYDVILSDAPIAPHQRVRSFNLAARYRKRFPQSLDGAPLLLPTPNTEMRRQLDRWLDESGCAPRIVAEINDSALIKEFGHAGAGLFPVCEAVLPEVQRQYEVEALGSLANVRLQFFAITLQRKLTHPAVVAISQNAREGLLAPAG